MKKHFLAVCIPALSILSGCASLPAPDSEDFRVADYGEYPANYVQIAGDFLKTNLVLVAPYPTEIIIWDKPKKWWDEDFSSIGGENRGRWFGHVVCATLNNVSIGSRQSPGFKATNPGRAEPIKQVVAFLLINNGKVRVRAAKWNSGGTDVVVGTILGNPETTCAKIFPDERTTEFHPL
jgi:hypothetical protein